MPHEVRIGYIGVVDDDDDKSHQSNNHEEEIYTETDNVNHPNSDDDDSYYESEDDDDQPTIISGWEHSPYAHNSDRYAYIGKEDGEPQWIDYGAKKK